MMNDEIIDSIFKDFEEENELFKAAESCDTRKKYKNLVSKYEENLIFDFTARRYNTKRVNVGSMWANLKIVPVLTDYI